MGRLFLFLVIAVIAGVISMIKSSVGHVIDNEQLKNSSMKSETKKVMDKTAKGVSWMEEQWENSKSDAESQK